MSNFPQDFNSNILISKPRNICFVSPINLNVFFLQSAKLTKLPPFMTISLLRFSFDFAKCERYKETGRYSFPLSINLQPFCEQVLGLLHLLIIVWLCLIIVVSS